MLMWKGWILIRVVHGFGFGTQSPDSTCILSE